MTEQRSHSPWQDPNNGREHGQCSANDSVKLRRYTSGAGKSLVQWCDFLRSLDLMICR